MGGVFIVLNCELFHVKQITSRIVSRETMCETIEKSVKH